MTKNPLREIGRQVIKFQQQDFPRIAGKMAVDEFRENFHRQGFQNNGITRWQDVKRRDKNSPWYGFQYKGEKRNSFRFVRDRKTGKTQKSRAQKRLNFSNAATQRGILIGPGANLMNSITVKEANKERVVVGSDLPYAAVHNDGGNIRIFGKAIRKLPKRQFIGRSRELLDELEKKYLTEMDRIVNQFSFRT